MSKWPDGGRIEPLQPPVEIDVTAEQFGAEWPFTVDHGTLRCYAVPAAEAGIGAVTFEADGVEYALNGPALSWAPRRRWTSVQDAAVWADTGDPASPKRNLGPIVNRGHALIV